MNDWLIDEDGDYVQVCHIASAQATERNNRWTMKLATSSGGNYYLPGGDYGTAKQAQNAFGELMAAFVAEDDKA